MRQILVHHSSNSRHRLVFYSSEKSNLTGNQNKDFSVDIEDVSTEELKRRIDNFYEGDVEALPSIFEAILKRKLAGKYEEADNELMKEIRGRMPEKIEDVDDDDVCDSDFDELKEFEDLSCDGDTDKEDAKS